MNKIEDKPIINNLIYNIINKTLQCKNTDRTSFIREISAICMEIEGDINFRIPQPMTDDKEFSNYIVVHFPYYHCQLFYHFKLKSDNKNLYYHVDSMRVANDTKLSLTAFYDISTLIDEQQEDMNNIKQILEDRK